MAEGDRGPGLGVNAGAGVAGAGVAGAPRAMEGGAGGGGWGPGARAVPARVAFRGGAGGGRRSLLLGLAPGAPAGPAEAFVSVPQTGLFRVSAPEEAGAAAGSAPVPHLRLVLEPGRTEQVLVDFEPGSKAKEALAQGRPVRDELMVWAAGRPLQVPLLVMPPGAETAGEQDYFPDQEVVARGLDIFLKSMRRHFPFHAGGQLPLEAEFPPPGGSGRGNEPKGEGGAERGGRARGEAPGSPVTGSRGGGREVGAGLPAGPARPSGQELPPDSFSRVPEAPSGSAETGDSVETGGLPGGAEVFKVAGRFMDRYGRMKPALRPEEQLRALVVPEAPLDEETELAVAEWKVRVLGDADFDARDDPYCLEAAEFLEKVLRRLPKPAQRKLKPPPLRAVPPYAVDEFQRDVVGEAVLAVAEALQAVQLEDEAGNLKRTKPAVSEDAPIGTYLAASLSPEKSSPARASREDPPEFLYHSDGSPASSPLLPATAGRQTHLTTGLSDVSVVSARTLKKSEMQSNWDSLD